jgi:hypothetical protein
MKVNLNLPQRLPVVSRQAQSTPTASTLPRLWPNLSPAQRHQLAQCLAELVRRQHRAAVTTLEETAHEPG